MPIMCHFRPTQAVEDSSPFTLEPNRPIWCVWGFHMTTDATQTVTNIKVLPDYNLISLWRTPRQKPFFHDHSPLQTGTHLQPAQHRNMGEGGEEGPMWWQRPDKRKRPLNGACLFQACALKLKRLNSTQSNRATVQTFLSSLFPTSNSYAGTFLTVGTVRFVSWYLQVDRLFSNILKWLLSLKSTSIITYSLSDKSWLH